MDITQPARHTPICIDEATGTIEIVADGEPAETYTASILRYTPGPGGGIGATISAGQMVESATISGRYTLSLTVGTVDPNPPSGTNNRAIWVEDPNSGDIEGYAFAAIHCGSGSQMAFMGIKAQQRCANCSDDQPVPVALQLKLDDKVVAGSCAKCSRLNAAMVLRHADDAKYPCCWLSEPIAICAKDAEPARWLLEKTNASTWTLTLRSGKNTLVTYSLKTKKKKDCTLPIVLARVGKGGKECKKWPKTVTVGPAPIDAR